MGLLSDDYYNSLGSKPTVATPPPTQAVTPQEDDGGFMSSTAEKIITRVNPGVGLATTAANRFYKGIMVDEKQPVRIAGDLTPEEQTKKFGGVVGSKEYYNKKASQSFLTYLPRQLGATLGLRFPDDETWDKMSTPDKIATIGRATAAAAGRMVKNLPKEVIKAPVRAGLTIAQPWTQMATGKAGSLESTGNAPVKELPWLGAVPTYFQSYKEAKDSGLGHLGAILSTVGTAAGDVTMTASLGESLAGAFKPRSQIIPGETVKNTGPIQQAFLKDQEGIGRGFRKAEGGTAEYYSIPKTVASERYGGSTSNTFLKVTPAGDGAVEVSVVKVRTGNIPKAVDYVKEKLGIPTKNYQGDFGPEVKLESKVIQVGKQNDIPFTPLPEGEATQVLQSIPPKPLKGFENKPITEQQLGTLDQIGRANGIEPSIRDAVIRIVTGKNVIGELTQAEYTKAAQTLATFNNMSKFAPDQYATNLATRFISPQRHWMRSYEETSGIPLYSEAYVPMEEGIRLRDTFRNSYRNEAREVFGKYAGQGFGEERRLISAYMRGEKDAILKNTSLNDATKSELVGIADKMRSIYDKVGPQLDIPTDIFLQDYQPRVQNIGGIYQLYKDGADIPKELEFFAKFKRKGNLQGVQIDDALALFDIYINSGSNRLFLNPVLERMGSLAEKLPKTIQGSLKSYTLEKLGYGGKFEEFLDGFVPSINRKLGINLPPDTARQLTNLGMSTVYSGLLSSPATWFRQTFQYPLFGYARLGPKFSSQAITKALSKEGLAEFQKSGFGIDLPVPYGEELAKDVTLFGRAGNSYKNLTQKVIAPNSWADNGTRSIVYHQAKMQFEDALSRYNKGEITWDKFEKELDFGAMSPVDRNLIRQRLVAGDTQGAFNNFVRDVLDDTNFPYRKGASSRIGYGLGGKLGTSLLQWPIEASHVLKRWVINRQWDKIIRFYAASAAISRTMKETFGFDFSKGLFLGPFNNVYSPFVKTGLDAINSFTAFMQNNKEDLNKNSDSIVRTLKSAGVPAGVEIQNFKKFLKSYNEGADENGLYSLYNQKGEMLSKTDFSGLFWGQLMGFPTNEKVEQQNLTTDIKNAQFERSKIKERVLELMQQEKFDKATELMSEYQINITPQDMDDYYIPFNQRNFQSLPAALKAKFVNRVFPQQ